ncbi:sporulation and spore germination protein [Hypnocyclicus thermotrophus]|uniref:Sporulation and spore germination protein n=1 Tax=Hypnocyclicus thermotrophus TaxID=1627895 RepID=A0AA46DYJ5_9FUSO|nr:GerMN domain-containing protein [Hypnocyclicus thermotrophus]TDT70504.1 sporulation and spore germination protein [Hypnocyclicus thermotrophus]
MKKYVVLNILIGILLLISIYFHKKYVLDYDFTKTKKIYSKEDKIKKIEYESVDIYIPDITFSKLIPIRTKIEKTQNITKKIRIIYREIVDSTQNLPQTFLDKNIVLKNIFIEKEILYLNFNKKIVENIKNEKQELLIIYSLVNTFTSIEGIEKVKFLIENEEKEKLRFYNITNYFEKDLTI